jgi:hypothetical protein
MPALRPLLQLTDHTCSFRHVPDDLRALRSQAMRDISRRYPVLLLTPFSR